MADRYFVNGGVDNNWGTTGNWSTTDGGAGGSAVPLSTDDVFFTSNSPNCTVNAASRVAKTLNFTGYASTITMTNQITVSGSITLVAAMTIAGAGTLIADATGTLTSNGKTWPNALTLRGASTFTLADDWDVTGDLNLSIVNNDIVINGNTLTGHAGLTRGGSNSKIEGTTHIVLAGTGTFTPAGRTMNNLTFNTAGTITFAAATFDYDTGTLTHTAGTIVTTGSTLRCGLTSGTTTTTLATSGMTWDNVNFTNVITVTFSEDFNCSGTLTVTNNTNIITLNGNSILCSGDFVFGGTASQIIGTTLLEMVGTGSMSAPLVTSGRIWIPTVIDTPGTITVTSPINVDLGKFTYTTGTVITDTTWSGGSAGGSFTFVS